MDQGLKISYETIGASSYLTVALSPETGLIGYQLEMLAANEISNVLSVSKRMLNGEMLAYYNITSRVPLSQILNRRKLKREEFIRVIKGAVSASRDAREYQLPTTGFVMEPDYIFVDPASCKPGFLFLPVSRTGEKGLRELILDLIMQGRIEMSGDNFVQVLLETVNRDPLSLDALEKCLESFAGQGVGFQGQGISPSQTGPNVIPQNMSSYGGISGAPDRGVPAPAAPGGYMADGAGASGRNPVPAIPVAPADPGGPVIPADRVISEEPSYKTASQSVMREEPPAPPGPGKKPEKKTGRKSEDRAAAKDAKKAKKQAAKEEKEAAKRRDDGLEEENGFDPEKAKKMFLLPQAAVMVLLATGVSFGFFTDEKGALVINNILAVVLVVVVFEVILYREAYVNSKKPKSGKKNAKPDKGASSRSLPGQRPSRPSQGVPSVPGTAERPKPQAASRQAAAQAQYQQPASQSQYQQASSQVQRQQASSQVQRQPAMPQAQYQQVSSQPQYQPAAPQAQYQQPAAQPQYQQQAAQPQYQQSISQPSLQQASPQAYQYGAPASASFTGQASDAMDTDFDTSTELYEGNMGGLSAYLEYYENGVMTRVPLEKPSLLVGHLKGQVDFALSNPKVSKVHAEFINQNGQIFVKDINSKNGTYVNGGPRIGSNVPYPLHNNDRISLANSEFVLRCSS